MNTLGKIAFSVIGAMAALAGVGWIGLQVPPRNFPPPTDTPRDLGTVDLPAALPAPVMRYFQTISVEGRVPRIETAVVWGRPRARFNRIWMPMRFQSRFDAGQDFRRKMNVTWFGLPVIDGLDTYVGGKGRMNVAGEISEGYEIDQGSNLVLWLEGLWMPSIFITDPRPRWEAVDDTSARLIVPFGDEEDDMHFTFDPDTGLISEVTAMRYKTVETGKVLWTVKLLEWKTFNGMTIPTNLSVTWQDEGTAWTYWRVDGVAYNVDIAEEHSAGSQAQGTVGQVQESR